MNKVLRVMTAVLLIGCVNLPGPAPPVIAPKEMTGITVLVDDVTASATDSDCDSSGKTKSEMIAARGDLEAALTHAGFTVIRDRDTPHEATLKLTEILTCCGVCGQVRLEGSFRVSIEGSGTVIDSLEQTFYGQAQVPLRTGVMNVIVKRIIASPGMTRFASARVRSSSSAFASTNPAPATTVTPAGVSPGSAPSSAFLPAAPQPSAYALVFGIERYRDVPAAPGARTDAERFAQLARETLGLPADHIRLGVDDRVTRADILEGLKWLGDNVTAGSRAYFFFSGHGAPTPDASTYLFPYDGNARDVSTTGIAVEDVIRRLGQMRSKEVLAFVDACFSGAGGRSVMPPGARPLMRVKEVVPSSQLALLTASQGEEISGPAPGENVGVFSKFVMQGLGTGDADRDGDGQITLQELFEYVLPRVSREAKRVDSREQHPKLAVGAGFGSPAGFAVAWGIAKR